MPRNNKRIKILSLEPIAVQKIMKTTKIDYIFEKFEFEFTQKILKKKKYRWFALQISLFSNDDSVSSLERP